MCGVYEFGCFDAASSPYLISIAINLLPARTGCEPYDVVPFRLTEWIPGVVYGMRIASGFVDGCVNVTK